MKILVTGANGYLGSGIVKAILDSGNEVIATDLNIDNIDSRAKKVMCNLFEVEDPFEYFGKPKGINIQVTDDNNTPAIATYNVTVLRHQVAQQPSPAANSGDQGVIEESPAGETVIQQPVSQQQSQPVQQPQTQQQPTPQPTPQQPVQNVAEQVPGADNTELPMLDDTNAWYMIAIALLGALSGEE